MIRRTVLAALALIAGVPAFAQYPDRTLTIVSGFPAGGMVDIVSRALAEGMKKRYPNGVVVVNRAGAGGSVAMSDLVRGRPDGYSVVLTPLSTLVIVPQVSEIAYKTPDDYEPFINVVSYYPMLTVRTESPLKSGPDFVSEARANPGKLRVGSPGEGTSSHLNLEDLMFKAKIQVTHVPFAGWGQSSPALLGGHIEAVVAQPGEVKPQVDGKRMRVLMVFQEKRHPLFPDTPTAKELGWDVANGVWFLLAAPKGTPAPVLAYLHDAARAAMEEPMFREAMASRGIDVDYRPGTQLRADLWKEYRLHTEILKRIGMIKN
jgi:tripartite-type tricarboxylate transporter receptor subunit TctC